VPRWQQTYAALGGERYRSLIAYARLLTGAEDPTDEVGAALRTVLSRGRRVPGADAVAEQAREALARAAAGKAAAGKAAAGKAARRDAGFADADAAAGAARTAPALEQPRHSSQDTAGGTSPYAPPAGFEHDHPSPRPHPIDFSESPDSPSWEDERAVLERALGGLDPLARVAVVLHDVDGVGLSRIAEITGARASDALAALRRAQGELVASAGLAVPPDPGEEPLAQAQLTVISAPADGGRHA